MNWEDFSELNRIRSEHPRSYDNFVEYGDRAIHVIEEGAEDATRFALYTDISAEVEESCPKLGNIVSTFVEIDAMEPWSDSKPYRVDTETYDLERMIDAWEHVSGLEYTEP